MTTQKKSIDMTIGRFKLGFLSLKHCVLNDFAKKVFICKEHELKENDKIDYDSRL